MFAKMRKGLCLVLVCIMLLTLVPGVAFATTYEINECYASAEMNASEERNSVQDRIDYAAERQFEGYSIDDIRQLVL